MSSGGRSVLIVEDDAKIARILADALAPAGYAPAIAQDAESAVRDFLMIRPVVVLLDLNLPGGDGLDLCREFRGRSDVPILIVTARVDEDDRVSGLAAGADDYVCKPFSPRELVARVDAVVRRAEGRLAAAKGPVGIIDQAGLRIGLPGRPWLALTAVEFRLLKVLLESPERVFTRAQLLDRLHDDFRSVSDRAIDSHVKNLRRKMAASGDGWGIIRAVYGEGYRYEP